MIQVQIAHNPFKLARRPHNLVHDILVVLLLQILKRRLKRNGLVLDHHLNIHIGQ